MRLQLPSAVMVSLDGTVIAPKLSRDFPPAGFGSKTLSVQLVSEPGSMIPRLSLDLPNQRGKSLFNGFDYARVLAMTDQERRWFNNIKKAIWEADKSYMEGRPEDRSFEEMCKAVDTAKTLRRSLLGLCQTNDGNKKLFTEFLDFELPRPEKGGMDLTLFDMRTQKPVKYSFSQLIYAIRCMVHENENLNAAERPDFHVLLDWTIDPDDRCGGLLGNGSVTLNARGIWLRLREVVTKFVWGLEAMMAIQQEQSFEMSRDLGAIRPDVQLNRRLISRSQ